MHVLCFDLEIDYEMLEGQLKSEKIVSLLLTLEKRGQIPQLLKQCQLMFPHVRWATYPEAKQ